VYVFSRLTDVVKVLFGRRLTRMSKKRNLFGLFKFNGEFDAIVTAVEVLQKFSSSVFTVKHGKIVG